MGLDIISNIRNIVNTVEGFLDGSRGISKLRSVDWDRRYLWIVEFDKKVFAPPAPFNDWFPASDVSIQNRSVVQEEFTFGQNKMEFPTSMGSAPTMSITFYDDVERTLQKWFDDWIHLDIQNNGKYISGLLDDHTAESADSFGNTRQVYPVRDINLILLDLARNSYLTYTFAVTPNGNFDKEYSQASEATTYTMNFSIVGQTGGTKGSTDSSIFNVIRDLVNRVI
jgi:hypothetical protein